MLHNRIDFLSHPRIINEESSGIHWCFQWNLVIIGQPSYDLAYCCILIFLYLNFYVEPWERGVFFKWPLSRKRQEGAKGCPLNRGSVAGEFTDNFVHPSNQPLNKGRLGDTGWGWGRGWGNFLEIQVNKIIYDIIRTKSHQCPYRDSVKDAKL